MAEQLTGVLREVLAAEDGEQRPGLSTRFTPERRRFGVDNQRMDLAAIAAALPAPRVDTSDAAASWLAATGTVGVIVVGVSGIALASGIYVASRRNAVTAANVNDEPRPAPADLAT